MNHHPFEMPRRNALQWLAAGAGASLAAACASAPDATPAKPAAEAAPTMPAGRLRDFALMRGGLDQQLMIGFLSGQYYAVVDDEIAPLFGVVSATFALWHPRAEGGFWYASFEHAYYTDSDSGAVLTQWRNPYNGRIGTPPVWTSEPAWRIVTPDLTFQSQRPAPAGLSLEHRVVSFGEEAGERVVVERVRFVNRPPPPARPYKYAELVTLRASAAALADPHARRVPCSTAITGAGSWRPWQLMGDQPGHLMANGAGQYGMAIHALPKVWRDATQAQRPDILNDPQRLLDAVPKPWKA